MSRTKGTEPTAENVVTGPAPAPVITLTMEQLRELISAAKSGPAGGLDPAVQEVLLASAKNTERLAAEFSRQVARSNAQATGLSVFTIDPRCETCQKIAAGDETATHRDDKGRVLGLPHPKPTLRYDVYFQGAPVSAEELTVFELELYNAFETSKEARGGDWTAVLSRDGSRRRLAITVPADTYDGMLSLPPLTQILAELLYGSDVANPDAALARIAALERRVAELTGGHV